MILEFVNVFNPFLFESFSDSEDYSPDPTERYDMPAAKNKEQEFDRRVLINRTRPERCDKVITLFQLNRQKEKEKDKEKEILDLYMNNCDKPYVVVNVPSSNMILVVVSTLCKPDTSITFFNHQPVEKHYNASSLQCYKLKNFPSYRRQLKDCFNKHINESQIDICGKAHRSYINFGVLSLTIILVISKSIMLN